MTDRIKTDKNAEQRLTGALKAAFEQSVEQLDAATVTRLNTIRHETLIGAEPLYIRLLKWTLTPVLVTACLAVVIFTFVQTDSASVPFNSGDIDILSNAEELDMYEDLEFYQWLGDYEMSA